MKGKFKYWYIKKRTNPQLGVYYIAIGNISNNHAKKMEYSVYGWSEMLKYETEESYNNAVAELNAGRV